MTRSVIIVGPMATVARASLHCRNGRRFKGGPSRSGLPDFPSGQGRPERVRNRRSANVFSEQAAPCVDVAQPAAKLLTGRSVRNSLSIQQQQARHKLR